MGDKMAYAEAERGGASARTRLVILQSAASVLARNPGATMAEIASAAGSARSTVHRHFAERADLVVALRNYADEQVEQAVLRARTNAGTALPALLRLGAEYFESADLVFAAYGDLTRGQEIESVNVADSTIRELAERGQTDGTIDPGLPPAWIERALWSLLYAAWLTVVAGQRSKHEALSVLLASLEKMLSTADKSSG